MLRGIEFQMSTALLINQALQAAIPALRARYPELPEATSEPVCTAVQKPNDRKPSAYYGASNQHRLAESWWIRIPQRGSAVMTS